MKRLLDKTEVEMKSIMSETHPSWEDFVNKIEKLYGHCDCEDMNLTRNILKEMSNINIDASLEWFRQEGVNCDCQLYSHIEVCRDQKKFADDHKLDVRITFEFRGKKFEHTINSDEEVLFYIKQGIRRDVDPGLVIEQILQLGCTFIFTDKGEQILGKRLVDSISI